MRAVLSAAVVMTALAIGRSPGAVGVQRDAPVFEDVAKTSGLTATHISSPDKRYIIDSMSGGVGLLDYDNDGDLDIVIVNDRRPRAIAAGGIRS